MKYSAFIVEHGGGMNKHQFFVSVAFAKADQFHQLIDTGIRDSLDECDDAVRKAVRAYSIRQSQQMTITILHS